jgi:hypothetical protein
MSGADTTKHENTGVRSQEPEFRSQNKKETCVGYGDTLPVSKLEEVSKLRETTLLLFWILTPVF